MARGAQKLIAYFRFYEELNDFLPNEKRKVEFSKEFQAGQNAKAVIEEIGIPIEAIDLVLVNSQSVDLTYLLQNQDKVSVYPKFELFDIGRLSKIREKPLRELNFLADAHLGKLAKYLRMLGFDTLFDNHFKDEEIIKLAENRVILSRDKSLLKDPRITHGYFVKAQDPKMQLKEIINHFQLKDIFKPFSLCLECNGKIRPVTFDKVSDLLPSLKVDEFKNLTQCTHCFKVYWQGSHHQRMEDFIYNLQNS